MKIGVIADVHSNALALQTCIRYMEQNGCEEFFLLGDFVSDTARTRQTLDLLYELKGKYPCYFLRGNREEYMIRQRAVLRGTDNGPRWLKNSASGNLLFTYEQLTDEDIDWFETLPICFRYEREGYPAITCCHGSPERVGELLQLDDERTAEVLGQIDTDYLIAAHTHFPGFRTRGNRMYINTGACGIAIGDPGIAHCLILHGTDGGWEPELLRIPYDNEAVIADMYESGMAEYAPWFVSNNICTLRDGIDVTPQLVKGAADRQSEADGREAVWPYIEERFFEEESAALGLPDYRKQKV